MAELFSPSTLIIEYLILDIKERKREDIGVKYVFYFHWIFIIEYSILHEVSLGLVDQQFGFQKSGNFYHRFIILAGRFLDFVGIN
jgi:hypothetical protein